MCIIFILTYKRHPMSGPLRHCQEIRCQVKIARMKRQLCFQMHRVGSRTEQPAHLICGQHIRLDVRVGPVRLRRVIVTMRLAA